MLKHFQLDNDYDLLSDLQQCITHRKNCMTTFSNNIFSTSPFVSPETPLSVTQAKHLGAFRTGCGGREALNGLRKYTKRNNVLCLLHGPVVCFASASLKNEEAPRQSWKYSETFKMRKLATESIIPTTWLGGKSWC